MALKTRSDFVFLKEIGEGSFSTVHLAKEISTGNQFAVKECYKSQIVKEKKIKYVHLEKRILAELLNTSPFFAKLYCTFQDEDNLYFVLSYCSNGDLLSVIKKTGTLSLNRSRFFTAELVEALAFMHSKNIIHRDFKPENILVDEKYHLHITDFGSTRILGEEDRTNAVTSDQPVRRNNSFVGTAQFFSPEILQGKEPHIGTDLWSLGCVLFQMITGKHLFTGNHEYDIFQKVVKAEYTIPDEFDSEAKDLIGKLVVTDPNERLGASEAQGYDKLRLHPFFASIDWQNISEQTPPE